MRNVYCVTRKVERASLASSAVSYQDAQFLHLASLANVIWGDDPRCRWAGTFSECERSVGVKADAVVVFDERTLLTADAVRRTRWDTDALFVFVTHDFWCHPMEVVAFLRTVRRPLMVLRHEAARRLFDLVAPEIPKVVLRPGVEVSIFHPHDGRKEYDVVLGGSETADYPLRRKINRVVREHRERRGWKVLDLTAAGAASRPRSDQRSYAPLLAAAKVSPTASNRGGSAGARLVTQYLDMSPARAQIDDDFYGLRRPDLLRVELDTAGVTPRYLESLASKTLLVADLPVGPTEEWYADKMVVIRPDIADEALVDVIDHWVRHDEERTRRCDAAHAEVLRTETSEVAAHALARLVDERTA
ncbi:MAG: glycosyltransferase family 1 protein [Myxococcales bacterium]|nr:glycosyltransferase family 1 protein [Myxococcales bacterium]